MGGGRERGERGYHVSYICPHSSLTAQVTSHCEKVKELEAYLGGEIPCAEGGEKFTGTWKEEREMLHSKIQVKQTFAELFRIHTCFFSF